MYTGHISQVYLGWLDMERWTEHLFPTNAEGHRGEHLSERKAWSICESTVRDPSNIKMEEKTLVAKLEDFDVGLIPNRIFFWFWSLFFFLPNWKTQRSSTKTSIPWPPKPEKRSTAPAPFRRNPASSASQKARPQLTTARTFFTRRDFVALVGLPSTYHLWDALKKLNLVLKTSQNYRKNMSFDKFWDII